MAGVAAVAILAAMAAAGRLDPWVTHDTAGYLDIALFPAGLDGPRLPFYGWLAYAATLGSWRLAVLPWLQAIAYLAAGYGLLRALWAYGLSSAAVLAVGLALLPANVFLIFAPAIHPELPAVAALVFALLRTVRLAAVGPRAGPLVASGLATGLAYLLRPSLLPFIVLLPMLYLALGAGRGHRRRWLTAGLLLLVAMAPFLAVATLRRATVGDFNLVSFGGFQLSGMTGFLLTPQIADDLPPAIAADARRLIATRDAAIAASEAVPVPLNSSGERSFISAALGYFDVFARGYESILFNVVARLRQPGESWVAFDRRILRLSLATVAAAPASYAAWVAGGAARAVGHGTVLNLPFALASLLLALAFVVRRRPDHGLPPSIGSIDRHALAWMTGIYSIGAIALPILVGFPAQRYIDSAALLLAAWPFYGLIRILGWRRP
jgi:hypothetical protein